MHQQSLHVNLARERQKAALRVVVAGCVALAVAMGIGRFAFTPILPTLQRDVAQLRNDEPDLGDLAIAVGLSYVDFRLPELKWRSSASGVAAWLDDISKRPSMHETTPE